MYYIKYDEDWNWVDWNAAVSCQQQQQQPNTAYHCHGTHAILLPHTQPLCKPHNMIKRKMPLDRWLPIMYSMSEYYADEKEQRFWAANPPTRPDGKRNLIPLHKKKAP